MSTKTYIVNNQEGIDEEVETTEQLMEFIEHELEKSNSVAITIQSEELIDLFREFNEKDFENVSFYWEIDGKELYIREF